MLKRASSAYLPIFAWFLPVLFRLYEIDFCSSFERLMPLETDCDPCLNLFFFASRDMTDSDTFVWLFFALISAARMLLTLEDPCFALFTLSSVLITEELRFSWLGMLTFLDILMLDSVVRFGPFIICDWFTWTEPLTVSSRPINYTALWLGFMALFWWNCCCCA